MDNGKVRTRGASWQVDYTDRHGKRHRPTFKLEAEAKAALNRLRAVDAGEDEGIHTLGEMFEVCRKGRWGKQRSGRSQIINGETAVEFFGKDRPLATITRRDAREYVSHLEEAGLSDATINRKLSALSVILKQAEEEEYITAAPKLPRLTEAKTRIRWLTDVEQAKLTNLLRQLTYTTAADLVDFLCDTGLRVQQEGLALKVGDLQLKGTQGSIYVRDGKGGKARAVPLTERALTIFLRHAAGKDPDEPVFAMQYHRLRRQFDRARAHLGWDDVTIHTFRHTCASRMVQRGANLAVVQGVLGHSTVVTTMRYSHLATDHLRAGIETLERTET